MIKTLSGILFSMLLFVLNVQAQLPSTSLPSLKVTSLDEYDGNSLWGYMNGGSDLYFEYGFEQLKVYNAEMNKNKFTFRIFRMRNPEMAFGIYSIHRFKCTKIDNVLFPHCANPKHFQAAYGNWYISILKDNKQEFKAKEQSAIVKWIKDEFESKLITYPSTLDLANTILIAGPLGWQNSYTEWMDCFDSTNILFWINNGQAIVSFPDKKVESQFLEQWKAVGKAYISTINEIQFRLEKQNEHWLLSTINE
ncbi:hypothetical protein EMN47_02770 [Prolixibacteraceae bacterium JC049]|nr:hypothetical protein [Prolixibacteraceae bacterium JC049]